MVKKYFHGLVYESSKREEGIHYFIFNIEDSGPGKLVKELKISESGETSDVVKLMKGFSLNPDDLICESSFGLLEMHIMKEKIKAIYSD